MSSPQIDPPDWNRQDPVPKGYQAAAGSQASRRKDPRGAPVVVVDFEMSFSSMVIFLIKAALAAIPAAIILAMIFAVASVVFAGLIS